MKKLLLPTLIILTLILAACTSTSVGTPTTSSSNDLPIATQLAVGTLQLTGSEQDVSAEQAQELIVYWQVYKELSQSETAAQAEIDGLLEQIQETMSDDQVQAISNMDITQQDVLTSMQAVGFVSTTSNDGALTVPASEGMPAGGPPADGGMPPDGAMPSDMAGAAPASGTDQSQNQSQSTEAGSGLAGTAGSPSALVEAVIQSLQEKVASVQG
jgi:hypothetical protein